MDAKNIHISSNRYLRNVTWTSRGPAKESEWIHFGINADSKPKLLQETIDKLFGNSTVYFVTDRHTSSAIPCSQLPQAIADKISGAYKGLFVWDLDFRTVLEIGATGVLRYGERKDTPKLFERILNMIRRVFGG